MVCVVHAASSSIAAGSLGGFLVVSHVLNNIRHSKRNLVYAKIVAADF